MPNAVPTKEVSLRALAHFFERDVSKAAPARFFGSCCCCCCRCLVGLSECHRRDSSSTRTTIFVAVILLGIVILINRTIMLPLPIIFAIQLRNLGDFSKKIGIPYDTMLLVHTAATRMLQGDPFNRM